tara:strand:- start:3069 stop:3464 length:396 start_codon:yes stop_codon:yes gene_type:complete
MKKILLFIILIGFISCSDNNDESALDSALEGEWVLTDVLCYCAFSENVDFSTHRLVFDTNTNEIVISNNPDRSFFYDAGTYNFISNQDKVLQIVGSDKSYVYEIDGDVLSLTYIDNPMIADDEVTYKYIKQ